MSFATTNGGYSYPFPPLIKSTASNAPSFPIIGFAAAPIPFPPKNWIVGNPHSFFWLIPLHSSVEIKSLGFNLLTSLIFKYLITLLPFTKINIVPGLLEA